MEMIETAAASTYSVREAGGWRVGDGCMWRGGGKTIDATIRWIGRVRGLEGIYVGIELATRDGQGTGLFEGVELFRTPHDHAVIDQLSSISRLVENDKENSINAPFAALKMEGTVNEKIPSPINGFNPLDILVRCEDSEKRMTGDVTLDLHRLCYNLARCDVKMLTARNQHLFASGVRLHCKLCGSSVLWNAQYLLVHFLSSAHLNAIGYSVNAASFEYWKEEVDFCHSIETPSNERNESADVIFVMYNPKNVYSREEMWQIRQVDQNKLSLQKA
ncbi:hypothetical protein PFISCL1PPCAC_6741 [Pristionchus fissidentatus]|uniref:CAP-Gly domain-containing protein n=1 Tax=Pristionchus fissidentatus TaxID=1538716 RepID=A0AAV5VC76_9BILA|nr:hypothetical protein PFISCL1PPCAC_6741 [Pristionchus fissidentatus]